jgi:ABC-type thiamin/hydroxymethylpyrimidine transport system permease subunit
MLCVSVVVVVVMVVVSVVAAVVLLLWWWLGRCNQVRIHPSIHPSKPVVCFAL